jgi:tetraacyldisaccharide 4'-kinase
VGNIVAGGTGKTPVTLMLAQQLNRKYPLAILSRGYCSPAEHLLAPVVLSKGEGPLYPSSYCGDEPYLLSKNLPGSFVFVGRDRRKASMMAAKAGSRVIIIDDGMQHRSLARDLELVVIDAGDPLGQGHFLPRGYLRDSLTELKRAHLIVLNHIRDRAQFLTAKHQLSRYTRAPIVATHPAVSAVYDPYGKEIPSLKGKRIGLFCGIGRPEYFRQLVQTQEAYIVAEMITPDHVVPDSEALNKFAQHCLAQGAELLLCTEKDKVKMNESFVCALPISWVKIQLHVVEGHQYWDAFLEGIRNTLEKDALLVKQG